MPPANADATAERMPTLRDAEALVGIEYRAGRMDCMHLAVLAQRVLFGRTLAWQASRHPAGTAEQARLFAQRTAELARPLAAGEPACSGDAVLWTTEDERGERCFHIGTLFIHEGERWVLHTSAQLGWSTLQRMADTLARGLRLEGIYRWLP